MTTTDHDHTTVDPDSWSDRWRLAEQRAMERKANYTLNDVEEELEKIAATEPTMTTTDTGADRVPSLDDPVPTHIEGVADAGEHGYVVTLELNLDVASPEEAADVGMRFRDAIGCEDTDAALDKFGFGHDGPYTGWHLHGPYGC